VGVNDEAGGCRLDDDLARRTEIERDMMLMGCTSMRQLSRANLRFR